MFRSLPGPSRARATCSSSTRRPRCRPPSTAFAPTAFAVRSTSRPAWTTGRGWSSSAVPTTQGRRPTFGRARWSSSPAGSGSGSRTRSRTRTPSSARLWRVTPVAATGPGRLPARPRTADSLRLPQRRWPLGDLQNVYALEPGSAEMPSAGRPLSRRVLVRLMAKGVVVAPIVLHTGVSSPEKHEPPMPERFEVPETTARLVNLASTAGRRVVAVGTTSARALESVADDRGVVSAGGGWTNLVLSQDAAGSSRQRSGQRASRAGGEPSHAARGGGRTGPGRGRLPRRGRRALPVARVRRLDAVPAREPGRARVAMASQRLEARERGRRGAPRAPRDRAVEQGRRSPSTGCRSVVAAVARA